jgi:DNA (cytosine-5)-methyltransferase 1
VPCPSIFGREKPLVDATLRRIAHGIKKHVIENPEPFIVDGAAHTLIQEGWGERKGQAPRVPGLHKPMGTQVAGGVKHALVTAFIAKHFGGKSSPGSSLKKPMGTVTTKDHNALVSSFLVQYNGTGTSRSVRKPISTVLTNHHHGLVNAFLIRYDYNGASRSLRKPLATLTTKGRFGLVCVRGEQYEIVDIGMRFLIPREQFRAQGFRDSYIIDPTLDGAPIGVTHQGRCAGNSVPPDVVRAIVAANVGQRKNIAA